MNNSFYIGFVISLLSFSYTNAVDNIERCFKRNLANKECLINSNYEPDDFIKIDNEIWYVKPLDYNFPENEVIPMGERIYVCGAEITPSLKDRIGDAATEILIKISDLCLCAHLALFFTSKERKKKLASVIQASFVLALLVYYVIFDVAQWMDTCRKTSIFLHYLFLCLFTWMSIMSYDCWLTIAYRSTKFQTSGSSYWNRYVIYCLLALLTPLLVVVPAIYLDYTQEYVTCNLIPGYGRLGHCFIAQERPRLYFFIIPSGVIFVINILLYLVTVYALYRMRNNNIASRVDMKKQLLLFGKIGLIMGLTWTLGMLVHFWNSPVISLLYTVLNSSQGIAIFFVFSFKIKMKHLTGSLQKHASEQCTCKTKATSFTAATKTVYEHEV